MIAAINPRSAPLGISAIISGAGVAGLTTALEFWRHGVDVKIFERATENITTGDVFMINPSALRLLDNWPEMEQHHREIAYQPYLCKCNFQGERITKPIKIADLAKLEKDDSRPIRLAHHARPKFHAMLLEQIAKVGIEIEYGHEVAEYFEEADGAKAGIVFKDGSRVTADIVVAADGLRGASAELVAGRPVPAKSSGSAVIRAAYPVELALKDPIVAKQFPLTEDGTSNFEIWLGDGIFGTFWRTSESMMWSITHPDVNGTAEESWTNRITPAKALEITAKIPNWSPAADAVIRATPESTLVDWKLMWRDPQPKWTSPHGRVVQAGDAAHTFLPSSGNGATQAMEDGLSLAACVALACKDGIGAAGIPNATRVHNLLRFERVSFLQAVGVARGGARVTTGTDHEVKEPPMPGAWLIDHDAAAYARDNYDAALSHLQSGTEFRNTNKPRGVDYRPWTIDTLMDAWVKGEPTILDGDWQ